MSQDEFLRDVRALASRLPEAAHALNLCEDRYRFMVAFTAVCLRGQTNLLPPSQASGVIAEIAGAYPGCYALGDAARADAVVPWVAVTDEALDPGGDAAQAVPSIPADHVAATVFTSGTTGRPRPNAKTWRTLTRTARLAAERFLGGTVGEPGIVATVPSQHMYGLETTVMMALAAGCAAHAGHAFYPADVRDALRQMPAPRVLITTPVHLRACLASSLSFPPLHLVVSATAPLDAELAAAAEAALAAPVHEIYGCTEAGSTASRRTVETPVWELYSGMRLSREDGADIVRGDHLTGPVPLPDAVEDLGQGRFRLGERNVDMLKVAGKRASLRELTVRLLEIPGVLDAVVFVPDRAPSGGEPRPAALVVAPDSSETQILRELAKRVDPVFLPRPLIRVPSLPRNAVGKLPRAALLAELERRSA